MITLQNLIDLAHKNNLDPVKTIILLRTYCANDDKELDHFDTAKIETNVEVLNKGDEFEKVKKAISLHQLEIPDFLGN